jgi:PEP-CTERM/exosortase A-associated glycosyltransferase
VYEVRALWEDGAVDHGTAAAGGWRYRASRALETRVLRSAQAVTTICHGLRRELVSRGIPDAKVTVIPNAVDSTRFTLAGAPDPALAQRWGLAGTRVIGFIGSFYGYEGLSLLLDATPALLARRGDLRVLLVGGGDQEDALRRQARERGIADRVLFAGRVPHDEIQEYYNLIDVLVYPRWSTRVTELVTPLKPLEAMAQGRLVVASDVGGHRELIQEGTALLFRAGDAASLAETVLAALESPERTAAMRAAGRRFVETERTWERSVSRYIDVYHDALNGRRRGGP